MINIKDINTSTYDKIEKIVEKKNEVIFYWKERWCKTLKRLVFKVEGEYVIGNFNGYKPINIKCKKDDLVNEINKYSFSAIVNQFEFIKNKQTKERKRAKTEKLKAELKDKLKAGDIVERIGKTPNLGLYLIKVDEVTDYGISGFYIFKNGERSNEYTTISWDYIKGRGEIEGGK